MKILFTTVVRSVLFSTGLGFLLVTATPAIAELTNEITIVELQGRVEILPAGAATWEPAPTNRLIRPLDHLRTGPNSRMALRWSDQSVVPFGALTEVEILPPSAAGTEPGLHLIRGVLSFFHRDKPSRIRVVTRGATAGIEGTEFVMEVAAAGPTERTTLSVIDGQVSFANEQAALVLTNGQQAIAEPGAAPMRTAGFMVNNVLQWCFYYPAVLDLNDLSLTDDEKNVLAESLAAYRSGDLLAALAKYPADRTPGSEADRVYHAALLLSVGQVAPAEADLTALASPNISEKSRQLANALRQMIAAVKHAPLLSTTNYQPSTSTELLAASYYEQSQAVPETSLAKALALAKQAVTSSPEFGFGWERVAELEFSFGHKAAALTALDKSLALAPRNAQALALKGFVLAAQNQTRAAIASFDQAIAVDAALGNAWLGRGLSRIRRGDLRGGREDLLIAAALEPRRAVLRSYLGKAWSDSGNDPRATKEFQLAQNLDPKDPTSWLYSALNHENHNRINEGIRDLEKSQELNGNRSVYRSELLLDKDRAARSANLARIYQDAGMDDVAHREALYAVNYRYSDYSAHLFLANSYDALRDPNHINLRYETPAESEYHVANLLAPVSAGLFSQSMSRQNNNRLFERDRLGFVSSTEYLSRGAWEQNAAQFGTLGNTSYSLEEKYRTDNGERINNDLETRTVTLQLKQQLAPQDTVLAQVEFAKYDYGDTSQRFSTDYASARARFHERQEPNLTLGYHHEWSEGVHTLLQASRLSATQQSHVPGYPSYFLLSFAENSREPVQIAAVYGDDYLQRSFEIYSTELQQIFEQPNHTTILGIRGQVGQFNNASFQNGFYVLGEHADYYMPTTSRENYSIDFQRLSFYGYHYWQLLPEFLIEGGLAYDWMASPANYFSPPFSSGEKRQDKFSPKAGFIWTPKKNTAVRFSFTRSLQGASYDQSYTIEPSQVGGFNQSFRSIVPDSVGGSDSGSEFQTFGLAWDQKFDTGTYLSLSGQILDAQVNRTKGVYYFNPFTAVVDYATPSTTPEARKYTERSVALNLNQLLGKQWAVGASYTMTEARLHSALTDLPAGTEALHVLPVQNLEALLHQVALRVVYNHPSGFFSNLEALWQTQSSHGYTAGHNPSYSINGFWQLNAFAGYRFPNRRAELRIGLLNLTDQDYQMNPLTLHAETAHHRTLTARFQFNF